jgi:hypothetical protein
MPADSEGSSGPEDAWQQQQGGAGSPGSPAAGEQPSQPALQREDWMTVPMARSFAGQPDDKQEKPREEKVIRD